MLGLLLGLELRLGLRRGLDCGRGTSPFSHRVQKPKYLDGHTNLSFAPDVSASEWSTPDDGRQQCSEDMHRPATTGRTGYM